MVSVVSVAVEQGVAEGLVDIPCAIRKIRTLLPTAIASLVSTLSPVTYIQVFG